MLACACSPACPTTVAGLPTTSRPVNKGCPNPILNAHKTQTIRVRQNVLNTISMVFTAHLRCTIPPYSTARAGMLIRPTSVAAVICHELSPALSQLAYGFTPPPESEAKGLPGNQAAPTSTVQPDRFVIRQERSISPTREFPARFLAVTRSATAAGHRRPVLTGCFGLLDLYRKRPEREPPASAPSSPAQSRSASVPPTDHPGRSPDRSLPAGLPVGPPVGPQSVPLSVPRPGAL